MTTASTFNMVRTLSDTLLRHGFHSLRTMPGHEKDASMEPTALTNYIQILSTQNETEGYLVRIIPKGSLWENDIKVAFIRNDEKTRVNIETFEQTTPLGENPDFKIILSHVVHGIADLIKK